MLNSVFLSERPEVCIVEASAGSGKTYALAKRYIQLMLKLSLEDPSSSIVMKQILALTFTNKAAYEMKERILEFLKKIALGHISDKEEEIILHPIGLSRSQAKSVAFKLMEDVIYNYNYFQVQTIDKFINALLSGSAFKLGLTANFKIQTNSNEYFEQSLDCLIDRALIDKDVYNVFECFLKGYLFIENRMEWFPKKYMLNIIYTLFSQDNIYGKEFCGGELLGENLINHKRCVLKNIKKLKTILPIDGTDKRFMKSLDSFIDKHKYGFDIDNLSSYFEKESVPVRKGTQVSQECEDLWQTLNEHITIVCDHEARNLFNSYIGIYDLVKKGFYELATRDDVMFLSDLNRRAMQLLDEESMTVEELYYRLATRFRHYLIDEFQDTSRLQWSNIKPMVEEALSTGGTLFYVGDRKQAIYGFRGGDVGLFDDIANDFSMFNVKKENLINNWRSQKAIVDFNNAVFSYDNIMQFIVNKRIEDDSKGPNKGKVYFDQDQLKALENVFATSQQSYQKGYTEGYVGIEYVDIDKKDECSEYIRCKTINIIKELSQRFCLSDIAILTRSNAHVEGITTWLLEEEIAVESERTSNITEHYLIKEIISLLKFLESPIDNIAFTTFILGEIFATATNTDRQLWQDFVFSLRDKITSKDKFYSYTEFRKQYPEIWKGFIDQFFKNVGLYPLYELMIGVYRTFQCLDNFKKDQGFLMHFLELVKKQEEEISDISNFLNYFNDLKGDDLYVRVPKTEAVRVLTIHKSKGLEFPVVIIPFLGMNVQVGNTGKDHQSFILQKDDNFVRLLNLKKKYYGYSDEVYCIYAEEYRKALTTELNNMYVALTRAECEMYAFIPKKSGNANNLVKHFIPKELYVCGTKVTYPKQESVSVKSTPLISSEYHNWMKFLNDEFLDRDYFNNRAAIQEGNVIHYLLSFIEDIDRGEIDLIINESIVQARVKYDFDENVLRGILKSILEEENFLQFFRGHGAKVLNEQDFIMSNGHTKRIDRLMIFSNEIWVVDFKGTDEFSDAYEKQVLEYKDLCKDIYSQYTIKGYVLLIKSGQVVEI